MFSQVVGCPGGFLSRRVPCPGGFSVQGLLCPGGGPEGQLRAGGTHSTGMHSCETCVRIVVEFSMEGIISTEKIIEFPRQVPSAILISVIVLLAIYWKLNR